MPVPEPFFKKNAIQKPKALIKKRFRCKRFPLNFGKFFKTAL